MICVQNSEVCFSQNNLWVGTPCKKWGNETKYTVVTGNCMHTQKLKGHCHIKTYTGLDRRSCYLMFDKPLMFLQYLYSNSGDIAVASTCSGHFHKFLKFIKHTLKKMRNIKKNTWESKKNLIRIDSTAYV